MNQHEKPKKTTCIYPRELQSPTKFKYLKGNNVTLHHNAVDQLKADLLIKSV